jgi:hypothetical protein
MLRKLTILFICLTLSWTTVACGGGSSSRSYSNSNAVSRTNQVTQGQYPVQQATYNDANGEYSLILLNTPAGQSSVYNTIDLQMASLTEEEIKQGKSSYAEITGDRAVLHLTPDFKIEYVHNVTETRTDPGTGRTETVIVRRESNFWTPFAGAVAGQVVGQALGNMLFTPQYYVPPVYQRGGTMVGYGGYGQSYDRAVERYQTRYQSPPPAVRNRQTLRTTGNLNSPSSTGTTRQQQRNTNRSTGSGFGTTNLQRSNKSTPKKRQPSFGSGGRSRRGSSSRRRR